MKKLEKVKLVSNTGRMFAWMLLHTPHATKHMVGVTVDHFSDETKTTTICRCLWCGKTFKFSSK